MTASVLAVPEDMTLSELARFLMEEEIVGAPVFDSAFRLTGVVSATDIVDVQATGSMSDRVVRVRDIMTPTVFTVPDQTPVTALARTMIAGRVHRVLVTHESEIVGILTPLDLLKALA
jgi:predicted transcriptional regulator